MAEENLRLKDLDERLRGKWISGLWRVPAADRPADPRTKVVPHLWPWADVLDALLQAREHVTLERGTAERRTLRLVNPGVADLEMTSHTMVLTFQLIQPGEVAPPHRHTMSAVRFILQGKGAYTNVDHCKMAMEDGDLILTPRWAWHEHAHEGGEPVIWIDGLDVPFIQALQVISFEPYPEKRLPVKSASAALPWGSVRPVAPPEGTRSAPLHYRWRDTYAALQRLAEGPPHPYEGYALEYANPLTGGPTLPTLSCRIQLLHPGQRTAPHRHTSTAIYHVFRGSGTTTIDGRPFHWRKGDTFIVPLWHWHEHANTSPNEEALLFSMNDAPILDAFGLYREEGRGESYLGL
ncbi:MAG TPA: cupin domain-containing protein [candidate division Zixibacteria bacterium]|nr:cupin domain-containing protein [candidate division Zixibacteria bacterium]